MTARALRPAALSLAAAALLMLGAAPPPEHGTRGMVAGDHPVASAVGRDVLAAGGNAVDAAVATVLAQGVVQPSGSGIGGGGFAVYVDPAGKSAVVDFRETAPAAATRTMFVEAEADDASRIGGLAVGVPGEVAGLWALHGAHGVLPWERLVQPAESLSRDGFAVGAHLGESLHKLGEAGRPLSRALFGVKAPPPQGARVARQSLSFTLDLIGKKGARAFYEGPIAVDIVDAVGKAGGVLTAADLKAYAPVAREPIVSSYRGWTVTTMPPPSSGGVVLVQALQVLEDLELAPMGHNSAEYIHLLAEVCKHAFADRANHMGDPDRVEVPVTQMLDSERIRDIQRSILPMRTLPDEAYGTRLDIGEDGGTLHVSVVDGQGGAVALTTTINTGFGSRVVTQRGGILLNNEMDDFVARPGEPNAYGLVGSEANAVAPGARPLSSMTPTVLVSPEGERIVVGASGGPFIISSTLQVILNIVDFGMDPSEAVAAPRMHHQWAPSLLFLDEGISVDTQRLLEARGHTLKVFPFFSSVQVVHKGKGAIEGASDPRKGGWPAGLL